MTVGELSRRTGVPIKALRAYTDLGLIRTRGRSPANYRLYDLDALWCVRWISELRGLDLTVAEIRALVTQRQNAPGQPVGRRLTELLDRSHERLRQRIAAQQQVLHRIEKFEATHRAHLAGAECCWAGEPCCRSKA
jgi:DNA-binding transcriptional MerR regulator